MSKPTHFVGHLNEDKARDIHEVIKYNVTLRHIFNFLKDHYKDNQIDVN